MLSTIGCQDWLHFNTANQPIIIVQLMVTYSHVLISTPAIYNAKLRDLAISFPTGCHPFCAMASMSFSKVCMQFSKAAICFSNACIRSSTIFFTFFSQLSIASVCYSQECYQSANEIIEVNREYKWIACTRWFTGNNLSWYHHYRDWFVIFQIFNKQGVKNWNTMDLCHGWVTRQTLPSLH